MKPSLTDEKAAGKSKWCLSIFKYGVNRNTVILIEALDEAGLYHRNSIRMRYFTGEELSRTDTSA